MQLQNRVRATDVARTSNRIMHAIGSTKCLFSMQFSRHKNHEQKKEANIYSSLQMIRIKLDLASLQELKVGMF